ncbi:hypothetical protein [Actinoplanes sp. G11-F43]|uniref:hypothetical protein n=1 Tax=Actinoplanes sp. G11-F43 TaxID=3424130 RepID=UPI003D33056A
MRRTALYLGGLFLATGATLAMAVPAQAADGKCRRNIVPAAVVAGYDYGYAGYGVDYVPVGYGYGGGYGGGYYGGDNFYHGGVYSNKQISQNGLVNVGLIDSPIKIL